MKLRPLHDRVIVKRLEQETKTASGIVIPDNGRSFIASPKTGKGLTKRVGLHAHTTHSPCWPPPERQ